MKMHWMMTGLSLTLLLAGCGGTASSQFSCNATAGDSCLSIEQVDRMTHFADDNRYVVPRKTKKGMMKADNADYLKQGYRTTQNGKSLWISPKAKEKSWA